MAPESCSTAHEPTGLPAGRGFARTNCVPAAVFAVLTVMLALASWIPLEKLHLPRCGFRLLTGIPCPFCGGSRAFFALANFEPGAALRWNPLATVAVLMSAAWFCGWLTERMLGGPILKGVELRLRLLSRPHLLWVAIGLNWVYVLFALPR